MCCARIVCVLCVVCVMCAYVRIVYAYTNQHVYRSELAPDICSTALVKML